MLGKKKIRKNRNQFRMLQFSSQISIMRVWHSEKYQQVKIGANHSPGNSSIQVVNDKRWLLWIERPVRNRFSKKALDLGVATANWTSASCTLSVRRRSSRASADFALAEEVRPPRARP